MAPRKTSRVANNRPWIPFEKFRTMQDTIGYYRKSKVWRKSRRHFKQGKETTLERSGMIKISAQGKGPNKQQRQPRETE
jgi:hypothetical protein